MTCVFRLAMPSRPTSSAAKSCAFRLLSKSAAFSAFLTFMSTWAFLFSSRSRSGWGISQASQTWRGNEAVMLSSIEWPNSLSWPRARVCWEL